MTSKPAASEIKKRGHLADQAVADGQSCEQRGRLADFHADLDDADEQPADDIDQRDHDAGDGVAADELAGTVHGPEEVGLLGQLAAAALGLGLVDDAGVQIGVDGHLPAGHAVQGEAGRDFADARGALGDHDELDHDDDREDDQADDDLVAGDELAEAFHDAAGRQHALGVRPG